MFGWLFTQYRKPGKLHFGSKWLNLHGRFFIGNPESFGLADKNARWLAVDPPSMLKGLVAPRVFVSLGIGLGARHARQRDERESASLPAPTSTAVLLLALL